MQLLFKTRIQLSLVIAVVISISIMGLVTYLYIINLNQTQEQDKLSQKLHAIQNIFNDQTAASRYTLAVNSDQFNQDFQRIADLYQSDINLYDLNGQLLLSTRPKLVAAGLTANYMNPTAFLKMSIDGQSELYLKEHIGDLKFLSAYIPIRNTKSEIIAYLNLPYFANADEYNQKIALFFSTIINSYVLIIFIISSIAFFIAKSLTSPLNLIQKELAKIKLGEKMKSINWKSNDEIGTLIQAYNKMITELEESANMLAKSERESAWKEMAKQVAHEIKNPLTPMKLGLQLLERAYKNQDDDFQIRFENFTKSFIQQIDNLTNIANEFANYAQMPSTKLAEINIKSALSASLDLFKNNSHAVIQVSDKTHDDIKVLGDADNFISIFNNLLRNAIQATEQIPQAQVIISLAISNDKLLISFEDNGPGIPLAIQSHIFEPSFTTKNSGMGLGLAIVKGNLTQIGADIWFESIANKGTTFYVLIPIINQ
jgi:signal transduction histidine kinase